VSLKKTRSAKQDKDLLAVYKNLLIKLPATNSPRDKRARRLVALEIRRSRRLGINPREIKASDLNYLERRAEEVLARNKRLLNAPKR